MNNIKEKVISILIPNVVGAISAFLAKVSDNIDKFNKPSFTPPSIVFPIVWTILYILMGISYGMLKENELVDKDISIVYYLQLGVNALWSIFFFVLKWRLFSGVWILLLALLVAIMVYKFYEKSI